VATNGRGNFMYDLSDWEHYKMNIQNTLNYTECADSLIPRWLLPSQVPSHATWPQLAGSVAGSDGAGAGLCWRRGESAFTTMLMLGLNSASYCTHRAATAASCR